MVAVAARPICRSAADQTLSDRAQHIPAPEFRTLEGATAVVFRMLEKPPSACAMKAITRSGVIRRTV